MRPDPCDDAIIFGPKAQKEGRGIFGPYRYYYAYPYVGLAWIWWFFLVWILLYRFFENILFEISLSKLIEIDGLISLEALNLLKIFWIVYILLEFLIAEVILKENSSILFEQ